MMVRQWTRLLRAPTAPLLSAGFVVSANVRLCPHLLWWGKVYHWGTSPLLGKSEPRAVGAAGAQRRRSLNPLSTTDSNTPQEKLNPTSDQPTISQFEITADGRSSGILSELPENGMSGVELLGVDHHIDCLYLSKDLGNVAFLSAFGIHWTKDQIDAEILRREVGS